MKRCVSILNTKWNLHPDAWLRAVKPPVFEKCDIRMGSRVSFIAEVIFSFLSVVSIKSGEYVLSMLSGNIF